MDEYSCTVCGLIDGSGHAACRTVIKQRREIDRLRAALETAERLIRLVGDDWGGLDDSAEREWYANAEAFLRGDHKGGGCDRCGMRHAMGGPCRPGDHKGGA
jgi:hypothetical protein